MHEVKVGCAVVRIHGSVNQDNVKAATEKFMKKVLKCKKEKEKYKKILESFELCAVHLCAGFAKLCASGCMPVGVWSVAGGLCVGEWLL